MAGNRKRPAIGGREQEDWNNGTMEYWNDGLGDRPPSPAFQYSIIPLVRRRHPLVGGLFVFPPTEDFTRADGQRVLGRQA